MAQARYKKEKPNLDTWFQNKKARREKETTQEG